MSFCSGAIRLGTTRRQVGRGGESVVGTKRPTREAISFEAKVVGAALGSPGPSTIAVRISLSCSFSWTSWSDNRRKRPAASSSSQTRITWSPRTHGILSQYSCGRVILPSELIATTSGANRASTIRYHDYYRICRLFSISSLTSTICYHIIYNRMWLWQIKFHMLCGSGHFTSWCETIHRSTSLHPRIIISTIIGEEKGKETQ